MSQKQIVGICGRKGAGKSTLAGFIKFATVLPFAAPIKRGLVAMGVPKENLVYPELKETPIQKLGGVSARFLMVTLGTEWGRKMVGEDFWVRLWEQAVDAEPHSYILVDDVRRPNEVEAIRRRGGFVVAIKRPGEQDPPRWWEFWKKRVHESESLRYEDYGIPVIVNDGTPEELFEKFRAIVPRF